MLPNVYNLSNSAEQLLAFNRDERQGTNSDFDFASLGYDDIFYAEATARICWLTFKPVNYASLKRSFVFPGLTEEDKKA